MRERFEGGYNYSKLRTGGRERKVNENYEQRDENGGEGSDELE